MDKALKIEKGFTLIEIIISVALISIISVTILMGLATASKALFVSDNQQTARNLAEFQMEYVRQQPYSSSYAPAPIPSEEDYIGLSVTIDTLDITDRDYNLQNITVSVARNGEVIAQLTSYKVK